MVGYNADIILNLYDEPTKLIYRPFSKKLLDIMGTSRSLEAFRAQIGVSDETYLSHLLLIDSNLDFSVRNATIQLKQMEDLLVELQGLFLTGEQYGVSDQLLSVTRQLFFKTAADLLLVSESEEAADLVPILSSLSYQSVSNLFNFNPNDSDIAAWSALMALDSLTLFLHFYEGMDQKSWEDPEVGDRIAAALIPKDGNIRRMRKDIFQEARDKTRDLLPQISIDLPEKLADLLRPMMGHEKVLLLCVMAIRRSEENFAFDTFRFFQRFVHNLNLTPGEARFISSDYRGFTSTDFAIFLEWLTQWSLICQPKVEALMRLSFTAEQVTHWKSIALLITNPKQLKVEDQLRISTVIRIVRMHKNIRNVRLLYGIFKFAREKDFPEEWIHLYGNNILKNMIDFVENPREHLFRLRWEDPTNSNANAEKEDRIYQEVCQYFGRNLAAKGEFKRAIDTLIQFEEPTRETMAQIYEVYKIWSEKAVGAEKDLLMQKREKVKKDFMKKYSVPVSRPVTPVEPINVTPVRPETTPSTPKMMEMTSPREEFFSPASVITREIGTSTDVSFVSAVEEPITPRSNLATPVASKITNISDHSSPPQEPLPEQSVEKVPLDDSLAYLDEFSIEDEENFLLELAEQKLKITQKMFDDLNKPNSGVASLEERYKRAVEEMERLKLELERERSKSQLMK